MFPLLTLCATLLGPPAQPAQVPLPDSTRQFRGFGNTPFAWGALVLRKGKVVRAFLPKEPISGLETAVLY